MKIIKLFAFFFISNLAQADPLYLQCQIFDKNKPVIEHIYKLELKNKVIHMLNNPKNTFAITEQSEVLIRAKGNDTMNGKPSNTNEIIFSINRLNLDYKWMYFSNAPRKIIFNEKGVCKKYSEPLI